jgi:hypothetical protein
MNPDHDLGQTLTHVLRQAAAFAPQGPVVLPSRRPRRVLRVALAAAALACVVTGMVIAVRMVTPGASGPAGPVEPVQRARPVEQVWPRAIRALPPGLPWGTIYQLALVLDGHTVLAQTPGEGELLAVDTTTGASRRLAAHNGTASMFTKGDGWIAWLDQEKVRGTATAEIHTIKVTGGREHVVATMAMRKDGDQFGRLAISGGDVIWSGTKGKGVFRVPLTGGRARKITGTEGYHVLAWPWVTDRPSYLYFKGQRYGGKLRNVVTGEVRPPMPGSMTCSPSWCVRDEEFKTVATSRDGMKSWTMQGPSYAEEIILDRFVLTVGVDLASVKASLKPGEHTAIADHHPLLVDLATGVAASVTTDTGGVGGGYDAFRLFTLNGRPYVLDMSAI